jgi:hypothetical protein
MLGGFYFLPADIKLPRSRPVPTALPRPFRREKTTDESQDSEESAYIVTSFFNPSVRCTAFLFVGLWVFMF